VRQLTAVETHRMLQNVVPRPGQSAHTKRAEPGLFMALQQQSESSSGASAFLPCRCPENGEVSRPPAAASL
jgi:hypothetical protein